MKFIDNVSEEQFSAFVESHPKGHILQTNAWGEFKSVSEWKMLRVGLQEGNELVATALILERKLPIVNKSIWYIPRGFVLDYQDTTLLKAFTMQLRKLGKKRGIVFIKIDPDLQQNLYNIEGEKIGQIPEHVQLVEQLKELGYSHKGDSLDFNGVQPRFVFRLPIEKPIDDVFASFHQKTRYNIRLAEKKGIEIFKGTKADLKRFTEIMKVTGERDGFLTRPLSYFENMYDCLQKNQHVEFFLAKYNIKKVLLLLEKELAEQQKQLAKIEKQQAKETGEKLSSLSEQANQLQKKIDDNLLKQVDLVEQQVEHPDGIIISGAILVFTGKKAWYLYGASDNVYRNLMPNYLLQWEMIRYAKERGCDLYDFRGISGDLSPENPLHGLYKFKKGFNGEFTEFMGEFDLVLNPVLYFMWEKAVPKFKAIRKKFLTRK